ncbi:hypothetical protein KKE60_06935 [Patescibacteria group bacterium]|nr:hypothetical protein [Patescibacteria group bacterium]
MDKLKKDDFETWWKESRWLLIGEGKNNEGFDQDSFLTPTGAIVFIVYDADGNLRNVAMPMPPPMPRPSMPGAPFNFRGQPPFLGKG